MKKFLLSTILAASFFSACSLQNTASAPSVSPSISPSPQAAIEQVSPLPSMSPSSSPIAKADQDAIKNVVNNFYAALTKQDGKTLFSLMTPALTVDEESNYSWLTGADLGVNEYRVFLRVKISHPQIVSIQKMTNTTYQVMMTDQIQGYSNADPVGWSAPQTRSAIVLTVVKTNGKWLVDQFTDQSRPPRSGNAATPKYNGFGQ